MRKDIVRRTGNQWWAERLVPILPGDRETLPRARMLQNTLRQQLDTSAPQPQVSPVICTHVLSCLVLSCLVLSCLVLSCLVLSCLVLSCLVLHAFATIMFSWRSNRCDCLKFLIASHHACNHTLQYVGNCESLTGLWQVCCHMREVVIY